LNFKVPQAKRIRHTQAKMRVRAWVLDMDYTNQTPEFPQTLAKSWKAG
jgi:hypothetical protein